jgi:hypothetical protein
MPAPTTAQLDEYYDAVIADEDDYRFEIERVEEPDFVDGQFLLRRIHIGTGAIVESLLVADPYSEIEAFRLSQATTLEERLAPFGLEFELEQEERRAGR